MELRKTSFVYLIVILLLMACCSLQNTNKPILYNNDLSGWVGIYEFYEFAEPHYNMAYVIEIYKENDVYYANIEIDGHLTQDRIRTILQGDQDSVELIFDEYLPDNHLESYQKGDALISFKPEGSNLYTYWELIQPMAYANEESGKMYFQKIEIQ